MVSLTGGGSLWLSITDSSQTKVGADLLTEDRSAIGSGFGDEVVSPEGVAPLAGDRLTASMMIQMTLQREERAVCSVAVATGAAFAMGLLDEALNEKGSMRGGGASQARWE